MQACKRHQFWQETFDKNDSENNTMRKKIRHRVQTYKIRVYEYILLGNDKQRRIPNKFK